MTMFAIPAMAAISRTVPLVIPWLLGQHGRTGAKLGSKAFGFLTSPALGAAASVAWGAGQRNENLQTAEATEAQQRMSENATYAEMLKARMESEISGDMARGVSQLSRLGRGYSPSHAENQAALTQILAFQQERLSSLSLRSRPSTMEVLAAEALRRG